MQHPSLRVQIRPTTWLLLVPFVWAIGAILGSAVGHGATWFDMVCDILCSFWLWTVVEFFWLLIGDWLYHPHS